MIENELELRVNRKSDIVLIEESLKQQKIQSPIFFLEYEDHYEVKFTSDYEEWELDSALLNLFPDYEFTDNVEKGRKEIRLQLSRCQSEFSTDSWGRQIENPINKTKYLIKKSINKPEKFNPKIKVLFENQEEYYFINIVNGINKTSGEKGFLLLNEFKKYDKEKESDILKDTLYESIEEAITFGFYKITEIAQQDFTQYLKLRRKKN